MKATRVPEFTRCGVSVFVPLHFLEGVGKLSSSLCFSRAGGREQQVESTFEDITDISDIDAFVVRRGGLPGGCKMSGNVYRHG